MHHRAPEAPGSLDSETDQSHAKVQDAIRLRYGQPVAQPRAVVIQRIDPHRAHDIAGDNRDEMQCLRMVVVRVVIGAVEEALLDDEDLVADAGRGHDLIGARGRSEQWSLRGVDAGQGRTVKVRGTAVLDDSRDCSPLHAWQRAHPALAMPLCIPLRAMYAWTRR